MSLHKIIPAFLVFFLTVAACTNDLGNYDYEDKAVVNIDVTPSLTVLANAEYIDVNPVITSSLEGVIDADNPNFEYSFRYKNSDGDWVELDTLHTQSVHVLAKMPIGNYPCWYSATDRRTGVRYSAVVNVNVVVSTSEGWMLLCSNPDDEEVRLDMLAQISMDRIMPVYDIDLYTQISPLHHPTQIATYYNRRGTVGDKIILMSQDESYLLDNTYLTINSAYGLKSSLFVTAPADHIVRFAGVPMNDNLTNQALICVSSEGNAFVWNPYDVGGGSFEDAANTSVRGNDPEYRVAPWIGVSTMRGSGLLGYGVALLYDTDNHRFIGWDGSRETSEYQTMTPLVNPVDPLFSFQTGTMDLVAMANTGFSNGTTYCIMQDGEKRHIYAVSVTDNAFTQQGCWLDVKTPDFRQATCFCAHSQYQTIYYAAGNKVYAYNPASNYCSPCVTLDANEEVTCIKFCTYENPDISLLISSLTDEQAAEFIARQYDLVVASYDKTAADGNGGHLRFYKSTSPGTSMTLKPGWDYSGFGRIVDVTYKEVRK